MPLLLSNISSSPLHPSNTLLELWIVATELFPFLRISVQAGPPDVLTNNIYHQLVWSFQRGQDYENNKREVVYTGNYKYPKYLYTSMWTCCKVIIQVIWWLFKIPGDLHYTNHIVWIECHLKIRSDQKWRGEIYLQCLGEKFDLHLLWSLTYQVPLALHKLVIYRMI